MNPRSQHTQIIESLGCSWIGPWEDNPGYGIHYTLQRTPSAPPIEVIADSLTLAGWRVNRSPFGPRTDHHTYLWAYPPTN